MQQFNLSESVVEQATLAWLENLEWNITHGTDIAPYAIGSERENYGVVVLENRLRESLSFLNPNLNTSALNDAIRSLTHLGGTSLSARNRQFHRMLVEGVTVEYQADDNSIRGVQVQVLDFDDPSKNDWLAVNQLTVIENNFERRPDVVLFVNGLPLAIIELKNPAEKDSTIWSAWRQLQTYKNEVSNLFSMNELLIISDGVDARIGSLTSGREWFKPWRTITGESLADPSIPQLQVMLEGVFMHQRFLSLLRDYIVFERHESGEMNKVIAGYHQFHAVETAIAETLRATKLQQDYAPNRVVHRSESGVYESGKKTGGELGDRRIGVVWHTQGSGKSLTMVFYTGRLVQEQLMSNPTVIVLTDRNDLDSQLFGTFVRCQDLLRQSPISIESREDLRTKLKVESGGIIFSTIQKFFPNEKESHYPQLTNRRNIVVIADEAHRSQYDFIDGYARHMRDALPNASFVGFTGTPIELQDANTRAVFGDYISIYDIRRAVEDQATVPIYYESRLAKLSLKVDEVPKIDAEFEEVTEGEELSRIEKLKSKWTRLEEIVGSKMRLQIIAEDIVSHFEERSKVIYGKAMVVCMSRRICINLYDELVKLRPHWQNENDDEGSIKIVMTGNAADPPNWQQHIRNKQRREKLATRFRDVDDCFKIVLVRDMWLTGFNAPSLHTMYIDKPMNGHALMQAIARVNRVFRDKPGGLVVDYLGLTHELKHALDIYTESGGKGQTAINQEKAVDLLLEKFEICCDMFYGFDRSSWNSGTPEQRLGLLPSAQEYILTQDQGKERYTKAVNSLSRAFALAVPHEEAIRIRDEVAFFQTVKVGLEKRADIDSRSEIDRDHAIRQIISRAVAPTDVIDVFAASGIKKPDISILSEEFLAEVQHMPHPNLAVELLRKLLNDEITNRERKNVVQARKFSEMLRRTLQSYENRTIEAAQIIEELIQLARQMREANTRGENLGLSEDEMAFYEALETNDSAVRILGEDVLCDIARELITIVRKNVKIDWTLRENVRANLRRLVKRVLRQHDYPPDKRDSATNTVLEQTEVLSANWVIESEY